MNRFKGTPAPWRHDEYHRTVKASTYRTVCIVPTTSNESNANAHLIAAAPELLEALIDIQQSLSKYIEIANNIGVEVTADWFYLGHAIEVEDKARTAIAKALGETK